MVVDKEDNVIETKLHSHPSDARIKDKANILRSLKEVAKIDKTEARELVVQACGDAKETTVAILPKVSNIVRAIKKIQKRGTISSNPKTLSALVFDEAIVTTNNGECFLLHDSGVE